MLFVESLDAALRAAISESSKTTELVEWVESCKVPLLQRLAGAFRGRVETVAGSNSINDKLQMGNLPEDLQWRLLLSADMNLGAEVKERHRLSLVCKLWRRVLSEPTFWQAVEFNTCDFANSRALLEALLSCTGKSGKNLPRIRIIQRLPHHSKPKVLYGDSLTLEMYRGAPTCFHADQQGLELWLHECHKQWAGVPAAARQADPAWRASVACFDDVMRGKCFRPRPPLARQESNPLVTAVTHTLIGMGAWKVIWLVMTLGIIAARTDLWYLSVIWVLIVVTW